MNARKLTLIQEYRKKIIAANKELTKKEAFKDLLNRLYLGNEELEKLIDAMSAGAETTIVNIPRQDKDHRGSADTLYNKIIIEFENNLKVSLEHAKEQLAGYLLGQFRSGEGYNFTLIVSDFINWKLYAPEIEQINQLHNLKEDELTLNEIKSASFTLTENNSEEFYYWIDRFLFREEQRRATLKRIEEAFGYQSQVFIECFRELGNHFNQAKKFGEVQVSLEQWKKFLSIAYGSFNASEDKFLIHTYLSIFAKMLAYSVISNGQYIADSVMQDVLSGEIFHKYNIRNFVDNDFFHWVKSIQNFKQLKKVFRLIAQELSTFDFHSVDEDILKGVYQELIDIDTRHSLGEYYTPDWLCERIVNEYEFQVGDKILDPSCGSGSFLRAAVHRIKLLQPNLPAHAINDMVYGIDIHPLSVQIAKTTMLLALGKDIGNAKKPVYINVTLANTLLAPKGTMNLFGDDFIMGIDKEQYRVKNQILEDIQLFDEALEICEELAEQTLNKKAENLSSFGTILNKRYPSGGLNNNVIDSFHKIYLGFKQVKENGRDSIWKFIVQNLYKPYFLKEKFTHVIGNPPWFTIGSVKNEEYQNTLELLAERYEVKPAKVADYPHLEIAAIFLAHCSSYFLKSGGVLAFVLPRSFFNANQHDNTRSGKSKGFKLTQIWDLENVQPLFRIPSAVLFADKTLLKRGIPSAGLSGKIFNGNLPSNNCNLKVASKKIDEEVSTWYYVKQGKSTAFSNRKYKVQININPYKSNFKQGATIVPRCFYFVDLAQDLPPDFEGRVLNIETANSVKIDAKKPWNDFSLHGRIESRYLFYTALSKSILPFVLHSPNLITVPLIIDVDENGMKQIKLHTDVELMRSGDLLASKWFSNVENIWKINKTEKNEKVTSVSYINWQNKLTDQNLNSKYLVLYNASAKDANATIVIRDEYNLEFLVESVAYVFFTSDLYEAYYLTAYLNSSVPNFLMKDFQAKGLFGARHVHKKILDIYFPEFNEQDGLHMQLAFLSETSHLKAKKFIESQSYEHSSSLKLGKCGQISRNIYRWK